MDDTHRDYGHCQNQPSPTQPAGINGAADHANTEEGKSQPVDNPGDGNYPAADGIQHHDHVPCRFFILNWCVQPFADRAGSSHIQGQADSLKGSSHKENVKTQSCPSHASHSDGAVNSCYANHHCQETDCDEQ